MSDNAYQTPEADIPVKEQELTPEEYLPAPIPNRIIAYIIDIVIFVFIHNMIFFKIYMILARYSENYPYRFFLSYFINLILYYLVNGFFFYKFSSTLGMKLFSIKVVNLKGRHPNIMIHGVRFLVMNGPIAYSPVGTFIYFVNLLFIFGMQRRCLHDFITRTRVDRSKRLL